MAEAFKDGDEEDASKSQKKPPIKPALEGVITWNNEGGVEHRKLNHEAELQAIRNRLLHEQVETDESDEDDENDTNDEVYLPSAEDVLSAVEEDEAEHSDTWSDSSEAIDIPLDDAAANIEGRPVEFPKRKYEAPEVSDLFPEPEPEPEAEYDSVAQLENGPDSNVVEAFPGQEIVEVETDNPVNHVSEESTGQAEQYIVPEMANYNPSATPNEVYFNTDQSIPAQSNPNHSFDKQETVEYQPPRRAFGILGVLLGAEYLARRRADKAQARHTEEYIDQKFNNYNQHNDLPVINVPYPETYGSNGPNYNPNSSAQSAPYNYEAHAAAALNPVVEDKSEYQQDGLHLEQGQHVEHSAWHNVVVDKHGREVVDAIEYGEGFRQEQREVRQDNWQDPRLQTQSSYAQPPVVQQVIGPSHELPSGMVINELPSGTVPTINDPQHQLPAHTKKSATSDISITMLVIMVMVVIAAFFITTLL